MTKRERDLLLRAAEALDNGTDPFGGGFLADNAVTLDEANTLADHVAACIRACIPKPRTSAVTEEPKS